MTGRAPASARPADVLAVREHASLALDVIIPTWNGREVLDACLHSVRAVIPASITIVDNASIDETAATARKHELVHLVRESENRGFAAACNTGIRNTSAPYILLLNQDSVVHPDGIRTLVMHMEGCSSCAVVGGRIEHPDGSLQPSMGPVTHPVRVMLDRVPGMRRLLATHVYRAPHWYAEPHQPAWLTGACMLVRRAAWEDVGPFDEAYFMYTEDLDWCARARKRGWMIQYLPVRTAVHLDEGRRPDRAPNKARWMREGLLRYFERHGTRTQAALFRMLLTADRVMKRRNEK